MSKSQNKNRVSLGKPRRNRGFSLVELMVSIALGLLIMAFVLALFANTVRSNRDVLTSVRLNQELNAAMELMVDDIRRTGYWGDAGIADNDPDTKPQYPEVDLSIVNSSCILYGYDRNPSSPAVLTDEERFGFRRVVIDGVGVVQMRKDAKGCAAPNDEWESLTDPSVIDVTDLTFDFFGSRCRNAGKGYYTVKEPESGFVLPAKLACDYTVSDFTGAGLDADAPETTSEYVDYCKLRDGDEGVKFYCGEQFENPSGEVVDVRQVNIELIGAAGGSTELDRFVKRLYVSVKVRNNRVRVL